MTWSIREKYKTVSRLYSRWKPMVQRSEAGILQLMEYSPVISLTPLGTDKSRLHPKDAHIAMEQLSQWTIDIQDYDASPAIENW